jgi:hypothetical protein
MATSTRPPASSPGRELSRQQRHDEDEDRQRQEAQSGAERRVAEHVLQVDREVGEEREHPGPDAEGRHRDTHEPGVAEEVQVEHRAGLHVLDCDEGGQQHSSADQRTEDQGAAPALGVATQHAEDDQEE